MNLMSQIPAQFAIDALSVRYGLCSAEATRVVAQHMIHELQALSDSTGVISPTAAPSAPGAPPPPGNKGERAEVACKTALASGEGLEVELRVPGQPESERLQVRSAAKVTKAKSGAKADVSEPIRSDDGRSWMPSIKTATTRGIAKASIINTTARSAPVFRWKEMQEGVSMLDEIVGWYWATGQKEDVSSNTPGSHFHWPCGDSKASPELIEKHRRRLLPILRHFLCAGAGEGQSARPADSLLVIRGRKQLPLLYDLSTPALQDTYLLTNYDALIFSVRSTRSTMGAEYFRSRPESLPWYRLDTTREVGVKQCRGLLNIRMDDKSTTST
jgi:hypothetical protein